MRGVLILGAAARHRPTDAYRHASPMVQDKIMALCVATQPSHAQQSAVPGKFLANPPSDGLDVGRLA